MFVRTTWSPGASDWRPGILDHFSPHHDEGMPWPVDEGHFLRDPWLAWRIVLTVEALNRFPVTHEDTLLIIAREAATDPAVDVLWGTWVDGPLLFVPREVLVPSLARFPHFLRSDGLIAGRPLRLDLLWSIACFAGR